MSAPADPFRAPRRGMLLTGLLAIVYFGFIGLVAFAPRFMTRPMIGVVSFGLMAAVGVILIALLLTGLHVWLGNSDDPT